MDSALERANEAYEKAEGAYNEAQSAYWAAPSSNDERTLDEDHFTAHVTVCPSPTFYRWVFGWGGAVKMLAPEKVKMEYKEMLKKALGE